MYGGDGDDTLIGGASQDGGAGNDSLRGSGNYNDTLYGGDGNDTIWGGFSFSESDVMDGGPGSDWVDYTGAPGDVSVNLATGATITTGGSDTYNTPFENVIGSNFVDNVTGDGNANIILGNDGNDALKGGGGDDSLTGGAGDDNFYLQGGNAATLGTDTIMDWGTGDDTIVFDKSDLAMNGAAASPIAAGNYYEGAAGSMTAATAYDVVVLDNGGSGYASANDAEDAVAAQSTSATAGMIMYFDSTEGEARMFYDGDLSADDASVDVVLAFDDITTEAAMTAAFDNTDFEIVA